jgi:hypothetical protein
MPGDCKSCRGTGYTWLYNELAYCPCRHGTRKRQEIPMVQYLNTLEDYKYLPTNKVACKKCLVVMDFVYGRDHGVTCYVNPTDKAGLVTCIKC